MGSHLIVSSVQPTLRQKVIVAHHNDPYLVEKRHLAERGEADEFSISLMMGFFLEAFICASSSADMLRACALKFLGSRNSHVDLKEFAYNKSFQATTGMTLFEDLYERIGLVAYCLTLAYSLSVVHDVFHVSILRKYVADLSHVVDYEPMEIDKNLTYDE
ncbi:ABC transporter B family member 19-like [Cucumis melo var. makuwa]|uniref:ABC transporter B family member 19-like n=1 Tax=Cucumis melo var. makuwa TaxID=1194695 RepID=A0A5D3DVX4_CUCMM|nr:ABC transporter B family member 19-like [Cucumis melo var. makuwa]